MDNISKKRRSANMARIRSKDTRPELIVRRISHALGYRHRLHNSKLPGKPDLVFVKHRKVIFVHGCFWHQHPKSECLDSRKPKSNTGYWHTKLERNVERDNEDISKLLNAGWDVLVIWDCETVSKNKVTQVVRKFLGKQKIGTQR